jgi:hypothetical protein
MFVSCTRPFFALLGLLFCLTAIRATDRVVIKDSEAIRYAGRYVEVRGVVVSVTTSPLGTAFFNFGTRIPRSDDQTFARFIAADSNMATDQLTSSRKTIGIIGTIELHEGKPEIKVISMYQIVGLSSNLVE